MRKLRPSPIGLSRHSSSGHSSTPLIGSHRIHPCPRFSIDDTKSLSIDLEYEAPQAHVQGALFQSFSNALSQLGVVVFAASVSVAGEYSGNTILQAGTEIPRSWESSISYKNAWFRHAERRCSTRSSNVYKGKARADEGNGWRYPEPKKCNWLW